MQGVCGHSAESQWKKNPEHTQQRQEQGDHPIPNEGKNKDDWHEG